MKTQIQIYDQEADTKVLEFDDRNSDTGMLHLSLEGQYIGHVELKEIMPAIIGFDAKYSRFKQEENDKLEARGF